MSMSKRVSVGLLSIIFLVALVSAMPAAAKKEFSVYRWWTENKYSGYPIGDLEDPEWTGEIWTGPGKHGGMHGMIYWDHLGFYVLGPEDQPKVQKFWGEWWIIWDDGGRIEGTQNGSFTYAIYHATVNGRVTKTTPGTNYDWSYLEGRTMHSTSIVEWIFPPFYECYIQIN
ncbi:MAG: hypothetical protein ACXABV_11800 [Candidatus Thorarchaeota archaeon]